MSENIRITRIEKGNEQVFQSLLPNRFFHSIPGRMCLGASYEGFAAGIIVFSVDQVMCTIDWLYVDEKRRGLGIAKRLIDEIKDLMEGSAIMAISTVFSQNIDGLEPFFEKLGFGVFPGDKSYTLTYEDIALAPKIKRAISMKDMDEIESVQDMMSVEKYQLKAFLKNELMSDSVFFKCADRYSFAVKKKEDMSGCLICSDDGEKEINIELLYNKEEMLSFTAISLLKNLMVTISNDKRKDVNLSFVAANSDIVDFVEDLTGYSEEEIECAPTCYAVVAL